MILPNSLGVITSRPALNFWIIGLLLFGLERTYFVPETTLEVSYPSAERIDELSRQWQQLRGRAPAGDELESMIQNEVDQSILLNESVRMNFHLEDSIVRRRLIRNMRFMHDDTESSDEQLLDQAYAMELHFNDLVVQRRLIQIMESVLRSFGENAPVTDAELRTFYDERQTTLIQPERLSFSHAFFSRDGRGSEGPVQVQSLYDRAIQEALPAELVVSVADPFISGHRFTRLSQAQIEREFGSEFSRSIFSCEQSNWCEPIRSVYGWHLVLISERASAQQIPYESVKSKLAFEYRDQAGRESFARVMDDLRVKYQVSGAPQ